MVSQLVFFFLFFLYRCLFSYGDVSLDELGKSNKS